MNIEGFQFYSLHNVPFMKQVYFDPGHTLSYNGVQLCVNVHIGQVLCPGRSVTGSSLCSDILSHSAKYSKIINIGIESSL